MPERAFPQTHAGMVAALEFVEEASLDSTADVRDRMLLVAGEALANAVEHGGEDGKTRLLRVDVITSDHQLELVIIEEGGGVEIERIRESELPSDTLSVSGRGLFLIRTLADDITPEGTGVRYTFFPRDEG